MKITDLTCPHCGAKLKKYKNTDVVICEYCDTELLITEEKQQTQEEFIQPSSPKLPKKKKKLVWWILGWIFIFPLPLTVLLLRNKKWKLWLRISIIAVAWMLYFVIVFSGRGETKVPQEDTSSHYIEETQTANTSDSLIDDIEPSVEVSTDDVASYPMQITSEDYNGPECWLLSEPTTAGSEKVFDIYVVIDRGSEDWHDQTKSVISLLWSKYKDQKVMFKIYNGTEGLDKTQPTYEELIATWQNEPFSAITESNPTITWYPNGGGVAAQQETENWGPTANDSKTE